MDILIQVDDASLEKLNVNKNSMNLVDGDRQKEILEYYKDHDVKETVGDYFGKM